jgi:ferredoxin
MARKPRRGWKMSEEQGALLPGISGNEINGLGEREARRPTIVYWPNDHTRDRSAAAEPSRNPFAPLISWFRAQTPAVHHVYTDFENRAPKVLDPVAEDRASATPDRWTERVKNYVLQHEGELVGITRLNPDWYFDDAVPAELPWVIMIGCTMDYETMQHMPPSDKDPVAAIEVGEVYNKVDRAAGSLANWIRNQGYYAENQGGPSSGQMLLIPPALECGFGELGKHGSIINREFGSLIRLSAVRTELPLARDEVDDFGADDFCLRCQVCANACPVDAIGPEKKMVRGIEKWYVDFDKCIPYFNENYACGICIAVCPWSRPGVASKMAERMTRRRLRIERSQRRRSSISR